MPKLKPVFAEPETRALDSQAAELAKRCLVANPYRPLKNIPVSC